MHSHQMLLKSVQGRISVNVIREGTTPPSSVFSPSVKPTDPSASSSSAPSARPQPQQQSHQPPPTTTTTSRATPRKQQSRVGATAKSRQPPQPVHITNKKAPRVGDEVNEDRVVGEAGVDAVCDSLGLELELDYEQLFSTSDNIMSDMFAFPRSPSPSFSEFDHLR